MNRDAIPRRDVLYICANLADDARDFMSRNPRQRRLAKPASIMRITMTNAACFDRDFDLAGAGRNVRHFNRVKRSIVGTDGDGTHGRVAYREADAWRTLRWCTASG